MAAKLKRIRKYNWTKRLRNHGFLARNSTKGGRNILQRRRRKGRHSLAVNKNKKI